MNEMQASNPPEFCPNCGQRLSVLNVWLADQQAYQQGWQRETVNYYCPGFDDSTDACEEYRPVDAIRAAKWR